MGTKQFAFYNLNADVYAIQQMLSEPHYVVQGGASDEDVLGTVTGKISGISDNNRMYLGSFRAKTPGVYRLGLRWSEIFWGTNYYPTLYIGMLLPYGYSMTAGYPGQRIFFPVDLSQIVPGTIFPMNYLSEMLWGNIVHEISLNQFYSSLSGQNELYYDIYLPAGGLVIMGFNNKTGEGPGRNYLEGPEVFVRYKEGA
ncbi:MAG: hypothetical protein VB085_08855 [Peptococcaceae bacterium]|nr:hypothetical protein [Peptococcaceae bacterium]